MSHRVSLCLTAAAPFYTPPSSAQGPGFGAFLSVRAVFWFLIIAVLMCTGGTSLWSLGRPEVTALLAPFHRPLRFPHLCFFFDT